MCDSDPRARWRRSGRWLLVLLALGLRGPGSSLSAGAPVPEGEAQPLVDVRYRLGRARGRPGEVVSVRLEVATAQPIARLSVALDFEESRLEVLEVRRLRPALTPVDANEVRSTRINNADERPGDQPTEGWVFVELESSAGAAVVAPAPEDGTVEILELDFFIRRRARPGLSVLRLQDVGPVDVGVMLTNSVEVQAADTPESARLAEESLDDGEIDIIGEVGFFMRGDSDMSCTRELNDAMVTLRYLFMGSEEPECLDAADSNDSGLLDLSDAVFSLLWLFSGGRDFPEPLYGLGEDPTLDDLDCIGGFPDSSSCDGITPGI